MVEIKLPYDKKTIVAKIPDENFAGLLESKAENFHNPLSEEETVERSMDNPIGSPSLEELAKGTLDWRERTPEVVAKAPISPAGPPAVGSNP